MSEEELIERIINLNYREFGAEVGNDLKRIIIKQEKEIDKQKEVLDKIKEKVDQYEFISGYYDDNYDGEDTTYSHDTLKEDILELLEDIDNE